jgi:flavin reductase (DIM6/NTAB) family NADH-FMN oxidoreductase RutF
MKIKFGAVPLVYPIPIALAGANVDGRPNFATLGDVGIMGIRPPLVAVSLNEGHHTMRGILQNGAFSVNFPHTGMIAVTDYCGIVSGREVDKSALFDTFYGELDAAPMIRECPVCLECRVVKEFAIQHRHIFVGEVVQAHVDEEFVTESNGRFEIADMTRLDPILYSLDNRYYRVGPAIGKGYHEGKTFLPGPQGCS